MTLLRYQLVLTAACLLGALGVGGFVWLDGWAAHVLAVVIGLLFGSLLRYGAKRLA